MNVYKKIRPWLLLVTLLSCSGVRDRPVPVTEENEVVPSEEKSAKTLENDRIPNEIEGVPIKRYEHDTDSEREPDNTDIPRRATENRDVKRTSINVAGETIMPEDGVLASESSQVYYLPERSILEHVKDPDERGAVYPIGWSKDGRFAVVMIRFTETVGYTFEFLIENMANNAVVYRIDMEAYESDMPERLLDRLEDMSMRDFSETVWRFYEKKISLALARRHIIQAKTADLHQFPFEYKGDLLDLKLSRRELGTRNEENAIVAGYNEVPTVIKIDLVSKKRGEQKQIFFKKYNYTNQMRIFGFLKSPYEERLAVIVGLVGSAENYTYSFIGTALMDNSK